MSNEYPDLLLPPFWGNSDILTFEGNKMAEEPEIAEEIDPRGLYCYFPVISEEAALTLLDPYCETEELVTLHFKDEFKRYAAFFRPEGDVCALCAVSIGFELPELEADEIFARASKLLSNEIKRGLLLTPERGKSIGISSDLFSNPEDFNAVFDLMSIEDRLGFSIEDWDTRVRFTMMLQNVRDE